VPEGGSYIDRASTGYATALAFVRHGQFTAAVRTNAMSTYACPHVETMGVKGVLSGNFCPCLLPTLDRSNSFSRLALSGKGVFPGGTPTRTTCDEFFP
jgi:hypothetical protein